MLDFSRSLLSLVRLSLKKCSVVFRCGLAMSYELLNNNNNNNNYYYYYYYYVREDMFIHYMRGCAFAHRAPKR